MAIGWALAVAMWRGYRRDPLTGAATCVHCRWSMPCACWQFADEFLAEALLAEPTPNDREGPIVAVLAHPSPLPRRQPGTHLDAATLALL